MLRGLWKLTWIEMKVFMREPLGAFGTIGVPVLIFVVLGRFAKLGFGTPSLAVMVYPAPDFRFSWLF